MAKTAEKKNRVALIEERTPAQRLADIRKNRVAKLFVTPDDQDFLLDQLDSSQAAVAHLAGSTAALLQRAETAEQAVADLQRQLQASANQIDNLQNKIEEFRTVYEEENRSMALKVERIAGEGTEAPVAENL